MLAGVVARRTLHAEPKAATHTNFSRIDHLRLHLVEEALVRLFANHAQLCNTHPLSLKTGSTTQTAITYVQTTRGTWPYDGHQPRNTVVMP